MKNGLTFLYISSNGFNYLWNGIKFLLHYLPKKLILVNRSGSKLFGVIIPFIVEMALVSDAITNSDRIWYSPCIWFTLVQSFVIIRFIITTSGFMNSWIILINFAVLFQKFSSVLIRFVFNSSCWFGQKIPYFHWGQFFGWRSQIPFSTNSRTGKVGSKVGKITRAARYSFWSMVFVSTFLPSIYAEAFLRTLAIHFSFLEGYQTPDA